VIAIVAGTRTKSGSTNFLRLHVLGERTPDGKFLSPHEEEAPVGDGKEKRAARKARAPLRRH
jgi:pyruvate kinase